MPLHVSLRHLHLECDFTSGFDPRNFSPLCLRYKLWIIDEEASALAEPAEEFQASIMFNWSEHSDGLLNDAGLDGDMGTSICLDVLVTICI